MRWVNTIEVITEVEQTKTKGQWRIGDAVIKDLKDNNYLGSDAQLGGPTEIKSSIFEDCTAKLAEKGIEHNGKPYTPIYVRQLFQTAYTFPRDERNPKFSWDAHNEAGSPTNLKNVAIVLRKMGKTVTIYNVRDVINKWADDKKAERDGAHDAAVAKKKAAKAKKAKASADKLRTKDEAKRAEAEKHRQEAQREYDEALAAVKENSGRLPFNYDYEVDPTDIGMLERMALYLGVSVHVSVMKREAKKMLGDVEKLAPQLSANEQQDIANGVSEVMAILDQINDLVRRPSRKLASIQGGRA